MHFRIAGLEPAAFQHLFALDDAALAAHGAQRVRVAQAHAAPCRISLDDACVGQSVLLLNHTHQPASTPYHQQGPIFVRENVARFLGGEIAPALRRRMLSLRGFDAAHMMIEADLVDGGQAEALIARIFNNRAVAYIHAHYARRGCFAARIDRA